MPFHHAPNAKKMETFANIHPHLHAPHAIPMIHNPIASAATISTVPSTYHIKSVFYVLKTCLTNATILLSLK